MKIALLGYGVVGSSVFEQCADSKDLEIVGVVCRHPGKVPNGLGTTDGEALVVSSEVDAVVEVMGGLHPAYELVSSALRAGKHVVTANKFLICRHYAELTQLAKAHHAALRCTAAVGGGIPWLTSLARAKRIDTIEKISGIMNGTTNYILCQMRDTAAPFDASLARAQKLGYAEADPTDDIEGYDVARKLAISASVAFHTCVSEEQVLTCGISRINDKDIAAFKAHGLTCKLLASAGVFPGGGVYALVEPALFASGSPEAAVPDNYNRITLEGAIYGKQSFFGQGAGGQPTAANVVQDLLDIAQGARGFYTDGFEEKPIANGCVLHRYYVRAGHSIEALPVDMVWPEGGCMTKQVPAELIHKLAKENTDMFFASLQ